MEIKCEHVSYIYNDKTPLATEALNDINVTFEENKIHGIIGQSGSGKTTLLELLNLLLVPQKGRITFGNRVIMKTKKIYNVNALRYKIGFVYQQPEEQFFCKTVKQEIEFGMKYFNKTNKNIDKHVKDALKMVELDETYLEKNPFNLSSGEKRKVAIASILAFNPKVIILDEPTIGLDDSSKDNLSKIIHMLKNRYQKTVIIATHDVDFLHKLANHIIVLSEGKIVLEGDKYQVFTHDKLEEFGVKRPKIIEFEKMVLDRKKIKLGYRDNINDVMKDVYRNV